METLKRNLINLGKGFIVWFILLLLNTRSNEAAVNGIKILLDVILASMIISENRTGRRIALLTTALTILITILQMPSGVEINWSVLEYHIYTAWISKTKIQAVILIPACHWEIIIDSFSHQNLVQINNSVMEGCSTC